MVSMVYVGGYNQLHNSCLVTRYPQLLKYDIEPELVGFSYITQWVSRYDTCC